MTGVFRQKNPGNVFMLFLLGTLLRLPAIFKAPAPIIKQRDSFSYLQIVDFLKPIAVFFPSIYAIIALLLTFLQAYLLTNFINSHRLMNRANFLPGMAFMLITSLLPEFSLFSSPLIVSTLYLIIFILLFTAHNKNTTRGDIFNAGLVLGFAILLFFPSAIFIIWAYAALGTLRPFKLNEWLLLLMGAATPFYFLGIFLYLNGNFQWEYFFNGIAFAFLRRAYTIWHAGALFLVLMPLLAGIYYIQAQSGRMLIHVRKAWTLFLVYTIVCFFITFFNMGRGVENWFLFLLPVAAIHGYGYFNSELKIFPKICFWATIVFIVCAQVFSHLW